MTIIAMVALYRPGPMAFIPDYIARMRGEAEVEYRHPSLKPISESTYGIPIYQEQLMRAAVELAGYTPSDSDELRKAISKKKKEDIEKHRRKFVEGAVKQGMDKEIAEAIYSDWEEFAPYGFNRSHAADYGVIAVETAYLKAHYPAEYMTALLSASAGQTEKVALYVAEARSIGLTMSMKNWMGVMGGERRVIHQKLDESLLDLAMKAKPALTILDAVRILTGNGPQGGDLRDVKKLDTVIAGVDQVAIDAYGATLFGMQGKDLGYVRVAAQHKFGVMDLGKLNIRKLQA